MATTMAATVAADRLYHGVRKTRGGIVEKAEDDEIIHAVVDQEFMGKLEASDAVDARSANILELPGHPSVKNSISAGAIGILGVKKTRDGVYLYFAHNTDSFVRH